MRKGTLALVTVIATAWLLATLRTYFGGFGYQTQFDFIGSGTLLVLSIAFWNQRKKEPIVAKTMKTPSLDINLLPQPVRAPLTREAGAALELEQLSTEFIKGFQRGFRFDRQRRKTEHIDQSLESEQRPLVSRDYRKHWPLEEPIRPMQNPLPWPHI